MLLGVGKVQVSVEILKKAASSTSVSLLKYCTLTRAQYIPRARERKRETEREGEKRRESQRETRDKKIRDRELEGDLCLSRDWFMDGSLWLSSLILSISPLIPSLWTLSDSCSRMFPPGQAPTTLSWSNLSNTYSSWRLKTLEESYVVSFMKWP